MDKITSIINTPIPTILIIIGAVFLFVAIGGQFKTTIVTDRIKPKLAGVLGGIFLVIGLTAYCYKGTDDIDENPRPVAEPTIINYEIHFRTKYLGKKGTVTLQPNTGSYPIYNQPGGCGPNDVAKFSINNHILQTYIKDSCSSGEEGNKVNLKDAQIGAISKVTAHGYWVECKLIKKNYSE